MLDNEKLTERVEILMTPAMAAWLGPASRRQGQSHSGLIRSLVARHLSMTFGPGWSDGEEYEQDHPRGDLEEDPLVPGQLIEPPRAR